MKNTSVEFLIEKVKVSRTVAVALVYGDVHITRKLYTNHGNNAYATIKWLSKRFGITDLIPGNDAPRGGKHGNFVTFHSNAEFEKFTATLVELENHLTIAISSRREQDEKNNQAMREFLNSESGKAAIVTELKKKYPDLGLSNKEANSAAFHIGNKILEGKFNQVELRSFLKTL